jgi:hypothetical protein
MAESVTDIFELTEHSTDILMYESNLKGHEGFYFARTKNDKILSIKDVCVSAKERGGYTGSLDDLIEHVTVFFREAVHLLRDGYGVNLAGIVELYLKVCGFFQTPTEQVDPKKNPVIIAIRRLLGARKTAEGINIVNWGLAPAASRIDTITDSKTVKVNEVVTPGGGFTLAGIGIKIAGTSTPQDRLGVSFYSPGSPAVTVGVTENLILNEASKIIGIVPDLPADKKWYVKVRTRYAGGGTLLKETREITSDFTVQKAP